jgi:hypothetical protein
MAAMIAIDIHPVSYAHHPVPADQLGGGPGDD